MVTKEQLVCSKEQAEYFKRKGVFQSSLFAWTTQIDKYGSLNLLDDNLGNGVAAYTTAEMIEMMPKMGKIKRFLFILRTGLEPQKVAEYFKQYL